MSAGWQAVFFAAAIVVAAIGIIVLPSPDRTKQPMFWLLLWAILVTVVWFWIAFDAATA